MVNFADVIRENFCGLNSTKEAKSSEILSGLHGVYED